MAGKSVTIHDVAARAGVSASTVSRVLSSATTSIAISAETRERVRQAAAALDYRPNPGARALSGKSTHLLGVITREISDPFFAELLDAISSVARERGYDLVLGNAKRDPEQALALRTTMLDMRYCDGILLCGDLAGSEEEKHLLARLEADRCLVLVARGSRQGRDVPSVGIDNRTGALLALEHLQRLGHRRIACLDAGRAGDLAERLEIYREVMEQQLGGWTGLVQLAENSFAGGYAAARQLMFAPAAPTALFALDDVMAVGALCAAADMGLAVPRFISIVGFDDGPVSSFVRPALTTVHQPVRQIGEKAVALLLSMIEGPAAPAAMQIWLPPELVVRDSTAAPRLV